MSLRARFRAKPYPNIGANICYLKIRRVGNRRIHFVFRDDPLPKRCCEHADPDDEGHRHCAHGLPCPVSMDEESDCASSVGCASRVITFDETVRTFEVLVDHDGDFIKQLPQRCDGETSGPIWAGTVSPDDGERAGWTLWSLANARQRAVDLAAGIGVIVPVDPNDDTPGDCLLYTSPSQRD